MKDPNRISLHKSLIEWFLICYLIRQTISNNVSKLNERYNKELLILFKHFSIYRILVIYKLKNLVFEFISRKIFEQRQNIVFQKLNITQVCFTFWVNFWLIYWVFF